MKKILIITATLLFIAMMVSPVLAFGPINVPDGKNKNRLGGVTTMGVTHWNQIIEPGTLPRDGVFKSWATTETGQKWTYQRLDAADVNIGNAIDGSSLDFDQHWEQIEDPTDPNYRDTVWYDQEGAYNELLNAGNNKWIWLDRATYRSYLRAVGYTFGAAWFISGFFAEEGAYFKVNVVGK